MSYGNILTGLKINGVEAPYPVVNEREVRAVAGIMFAVGLITLMVTFFTKNFTLASFVIPIYWLDFLLKVINPSYSIIGFLGRKLVAGQNPEYIGAIQKRFAWSLGLIISSTIALLIFGLEIRGWVPLSLCSACLALMWLESACGICVGCKIYYMLIDFGWIKPPAINPACTGGACSIDGKPLA